MSPVRIVTDSAADIDAETADELGISVVPMTVTFGSEAYLHTELSNDEFWEYPSEALDWGVANCEGSSIALCALLRTFVPPERAFVAVGEVPGGHAWVVYNDGIEERILETTLRSAPANPWRTYFDYRELWRFNDVSRVGDIQLVPKRDELAKLFNGKPPVEEEQHAGFFPAKFMKYPFQTCLNACTLRVPMRQGLLDPSVEFIRPGRFIALCITIPGFLPSQSGFLCKLFKELEHFSFQGSRRFNVLHPFCKGGNKIGIPHIVVRRHQPD